MPMRAASMTVSLRDAATQTGGWGRCSGLGTMLRSGIEKCTPS